MDSTSTGTLAPIQSNTTIRSDSVNRTSLVTQHPSARTLGFSARHEARYEAGHLAGQLQQAGLELLESRIARLPWDQHQVETLRKVRLLQSESLAEQSLQTVPTHRIPMLLRNTQAKSRAPTIQPHVGKHQ